MSLPFGLSRIFRKSRPQATRSFEGAAGGRRWAGAGEMAAANAQALAARRPLMLRARHQAANHPMAAAAVEVLTAGLVGTGFTPRPQHPDKAVRRAMGNAWYYWAQQVGDGCLLNTLALVARCVVRDGEALARIKLREVGGRLALRMRVLDPEQLDASVTRELGGGARIISGIEFNAAGERVAYHIRPGAADLPFATLAPAVRVPAEEILHVFERRYPGQVRGVSALAPVLPKMHDYDATSDALLARLKVEALFVGFIRDQDGAGGGLASGPGPVAQVEFEPGTLVNLPPGTDITFSNPTAGNADTIAFLKLQQREIAAGMGLLYEQLSGDLSATNYSSARFGLLEYRRRLRLMQQTVLVDQFLSPLWRRFVEVQAFNGQISRSAFDRDPAAFTAVRWIFPGFEMQDPEKEIKADALAVANGFKSRVDVVQARGLDIDEINAELAADTFQPRTSAGDAL